MTREEALQLGIPEGYVQFFLTMTPIEARTQRCEDCGCIIKVHDDARWRFRLHRIRCEDCYLQALLRGYTEYEALYVV